MTTALSLAVVTALSAAVGIVIAREFGRSPETDGFFAAYGVFLVLVLAANAVRVAVLPPLARARHAGRLAGEMGAYAVAFSIVTIPLVGMALLGDEVIGGLLSGGGAELAQGTAAESIRWLVPAAVAHLYAGLAASGLAALDEYLVPAIGFALASAIGLGFILLRVEEDGIVAIAMAMALNGSVALLVPLVALAARARALAMPLAATRPIGGSSASRLAESARSVSVPLAIQTLYVVCIPFAAREGIGVVTSFGYAYLIGASVVAVAGSSLALVTAVPLSRSCIGSERAARHVVASCWLTIPVIGGTAGVFALAGGPITSAILGNAYAGNVGDELGVLVLALSPWMVVTVVMSTTLPLVFISGSTRHLPILSIALVVLSVPSVWLSQSAGGLIGIVMAMTALTALATVASLRILGSLQATGPGLGNAVLVTIAAAVGAFGLASMLSPAVPSALVGLSAYILVLVVIRPRGLLSSWQYVRTFT